MKRDMNQGMSDGQQPKSRRSTDEQQLGWYGAAKRCASRILFEDIPTYLARKLVHCITRVGRSNNLQATNQKKLVPVYDLANAGPRHRFTVVGDSSFVVSNCVQSSGHDALMIYLVLLEEELLKTGRRWKWFIPDWHDETMIQCHKSDAKDLTHAFDTARVRLNEILGGIIDLSISPNIACNLAAAKLEEYEATHSIEFDDDEDEEDESNEEEE